MDGRATQKIDADTLRDWLESGGRLLLIDLLPPPHYEARHIPGASNACVYEVTFTEQVKALAPDRREKIVIYGAGDKSLDSVAAAAKLAREGYRNAFVLAGGLEAWAEAGNPLEGDATDRSDPPHPPLVMETRVYRVDPAKSTIAWRGRNPNGVHHGSLGLSGGELDCTEGIRGRFDLDMASIKNHDLAGNKLQPVLVAHLLSDDFFFCRRFPAAVFRLNQARQVEDPLPTSPNYRVRGSLELKGVSRELFFDAHISNLEGGALCLQANLEWDRTQWGVIYGSARFFHHLDYHVVYDLVGLEVRVVVN